MGYFFLVFCQRFFVSVLCLSKLFWHLSTLAVFSVNFRGLFFREKENCFSFFVKHKLKDSNVACVRLPGSNSISWVTLRTVWCNAPLHWCDTACFGFCAYFHGSSHHTFVKWTMHQRKFKNIPPQEKKKKCTEIRWCVWSEKPAMFCAHVSFAAFCSKNFSSLWGHQRTFSRR